MTPDDVEDLGHMDNVVRRAIELGLSPLQAIQAVTLNVATYSGLEQDIGGIAPGRFADILLIDDLERCHVREVLIAAKVVARGGVSEVTQQPIPVPPETMYSLKLGLEVGPNVFRIVAPSAAPKVRVMELVNQTITAERVIEFAAPNGFVEANLSDDLLKVAMFDRHQRTKRVAFGFLKGFGAKVGAVGLTTNLDENTLMIVGNDDRDMALCANALLDAGGGLAVVVGGKILEHLDFPVGGIFSLRPWQEVGRALKRIQHRLKEMGSSFDKPIFAISFLPFVTLPALRITARGLVNAKERQIVSLFAD
jgi:adenine deaminase